MNDLEARLNVQIVGLTSFYTPMGSDIGSWRPEPRDLPFSEGQDLVEFAGRACYQSWTKPNPATATNEGYIKHILEVGHFSVLEHASVSLYIEGVSRSLTHELVRHRHFAYSQLSQRYVPAAKAKYVRPLAFSDEENAKVAKHFKESVDLYQELNDGLIDSLDDSLQGTMRKKSARQAARAVLPNDTETRLVMTGNYRAWRHFIKMRASEAADVEIRRLAVEVLRKLNNVAPAVFADFTITKLEDGTEVAQSVIEDEYANS